MRQIILSQEFQLLLPFFLFVLALMILWTIFQKIIQAMHNKRLMKELEKTFFETGVDIMNKLDGKTMFEDVMKGILPTGGSGNQKQQVQLLMGVMQGLSNQSVGIVQKVRQLTLIQAASAEMQNGNEIIDAVDNHIFGANSQLSAETPVLVASALGNQEEQEVSNAVHGLATEGRNGTEPTAEVVTQPVTTETKGGAADTPLEIDATTPMNVELAKSIVRTQECLKLCLRAHVEGSVLLSDFELKNLLLDDLIETLAKEEKAGLLFKIKRGDELLAFLKGIKNSQ